MSRLFFEDEKSAYDYEEKANQIIPAEIFFQVSHRKNRKDREGDYFLNSFKLGGI